MSLTLKQWRRVKEISIETMSKELGVHPNTYANWEKRPETISIEMGKKIADILEIPANYIFFASDTTKCSKEE